VGEKHPLARPYWPLLVAGSAMMMRAKLEDLGARFLDGQHDAGWLSRSCPNTCPVDEFVV
jgi:hypothetical protein